MGRARLLRLTGLIASRQTFWQIAILRFIMTRRPGADGRIDIVKLRPIARLGYKNNVSVEAVFQMEKRMPEDRLLRIDSGA